MKKSFIIFAVVFLLLISCNLYSQSGWFVQNSGVTHLLKAVYFSHPDTGWVVGYSGTFLKTVDGGNTWVDLNVNTLESIYDIKGCWACATSGKVFKADALGNNWTMYSSGGTGTVYSIYFLNNLTGMVVGDYAKISRTTTGGTNWVNITNPATLRLTGIDFNGNWCWVIGSGGKLLESTNLGNNWAVIPTPTGVELTDVHYRISNSVICGNTGVIIRSVNSGGSWTSQTLTAYDLNRLSFPNDGQIGWVVGDVGRIFRTNNGGENWIQQTSNTTRDLHGVYFINSLTGWAVGSYGTILKTIDGGGTVSVSQIGNEVPDNFYLSQNFPNPFNPVTKIEFALKDKANISLSVYNSQGKLVSVLYCGFLNEGFYFYNFDATDLSSGVYYYILNAGDFSDTKRMVVLK